MKPTEQSIKQLLGDNIIFIDHYHSYTKQQCEYCLTKHCNTLITIEGETTSNQLKIGFNCLKKLSYKMIQLSEYKMSLSLFKSLDKLISTYYEKEKDSELLYK